MGASEYSNKWRIGDTVVTSVVEQAFDWSSPSFLFPDATNELVQRYSWLVPDFADSEGNINGSIQALVIDQPDRRILVDPCVGNGRTRFLPNWHMQEFHFLSASLQRGSPRVSGHRASHHHLHADHVGWDTCFQGESDPDLYQGQIRFMSGRTQWHVF